MVIVITVIRDFQKYGVCIAAFTSVKNLLVCIINTHLIHPNTIGHNPDLVTF